MGGLNKRLNRRRSEFTLWEKRFQLPFLPMYWKILRHPTVLHSSQCWLAWKDYLVIISSYYTFIFADKLSTAVLGMERNVLTISPGHTFMLVCTIRYLGNILQKASLEPIYLG